MPLPPTTADSPQMGDSCPPPCSASSELIEVLREWANEFCLQRHPVSLAIYRAIQKLREAEYVGKWIKATDINHPGEWYWTRLGDDDESCPQIVFVTLEHDGDAASDFMVEHVGVDCHKAKRLKYYAANGWQFMPVPMPETLLLGAERMSEAQCSSPSAPGGNPSLLNVKVHTPLPAGASDETGGIHETTKRLRRQRCW